MAVEIERRFLVNGNWRTYVSERVLLVQGYLSVEKECSVRVRICGEQAWLTVKGFISDVSRSEYEYEIPVAEAEEILQGMCPFRVEKYRYPVKVGDVVFEVDEYLGENAPLVVAEVELPSENAAFAKPEWLGREITSDGRFSNAYLSKHPFPTWEV